MRVILAILLVVILTGASHPTPAPQYRTLRMFLEYDELGEYRALVVDEKGARHALNAFVQAEGVRLVGWERADDGYLVGAFEGAP